MSLPAPFGFYSNQIGLSSCGRETQAVHRIRFLNEGIGTSSESWLTATLASCSHSQSAAIDLTPSSRNQPLTAPLQDDPWQRLSYFTHLPPIRLAQILEHLHSAILVRVSTDGPSFKFNARHWETARSSALTEVILADTTAAITIIDAILTIASLLH